MTNGARIHFMTTLALALSVLAAPAGVAIDGAIVEWEDAERAATVADPLAPARALGCATIGTTAALPCEAWASRYCASTCKNNPAYLVEVSPDSTRIYTVGYVSDSVGSAYLVVATTQSGTRLWTQEYRGNGSYTAPAAMALSPDGSKLFVTGFVQLESCCFAGEYATVAYDTAGGTLLWVARYDGGVGNNVPSGIVAGLSGDRVYVTGSSASGSPTRMDYATVAYDVQTGDQAWVAIYNGETGYDRGWGDYDSASAIALSPNGDRVFVTGWTLSSGTELDVVTVAYDAAGGAHLWDAKFDGRRPGGPVSQDTANSLRVSPDGARLFVGGTTSGSGARELLVLAYDTTTGQRMWSETYGHASTSRPDDVMRGIDVAPDGSRVFASGLSWQNNRYAYVTLALDAATGSRDWVARYQGPTGGDSRATDVRASPDSTRVHVTGMSVGIAGAWAYDIATLTYDAETGDVVHVWRYDGPTKGPDYGFALAPSPDNERVYVAGLSAGINGFFFTTLAYDT